MKPTGPTNPQTRKTIELLLEQFKKEKAKIWRYVAEKLQTPRRRKIEVNVSKFEKYCNDGDYVVVPGVVLGNGELTKKVYVAALRFSKQAKEKIENAGGKCMSIEELIKINPKGSNVRVMA